MPGSIMFKILMKCQGFMSDLGFFRFWGKEVDISFSAKLEALLFVLKLLAK
jgi:hypothetical protein